MKLSCNTLNLELTTPKKGGVTDTQLLCNDFLLTTTGIVINNVYTELGNN